MCPIQNSQSIEHALAFSETDWTREQWLNQTRWIAKLSDGSAVIQNDFEPSSYHHSAWKRLRDYIYQTDLSVVDFFIQFRSHIEKPLPPSAAGYFFQKGFLGAFGNPQGMNYYVIGYVKDDDVLIQKWRVPELILDEEETRPLDTDNVGVIMNYARRISLRVSGTLI